MFKKLVNSVKWLIKQAYKHPILTIIFTVLLAVSAYYILPFIALTPLAYVLAATVCLIGGSILGGVLGWLKSKATGKKFDEEAISLAHSSDQLSLSDRPRDQSPEHKNISIESKSPPLGLF